MKLLYYLKRSFRIQYNDFATSTAIPGYKFTHCSEPKLIKIFWHTLLCFSFYTMVVICTKFYDQYENQATLTVFEILDQGTDLPYPAVYLCLGYPLNPRKLRKHRHEFLNTLNSTMTLKDIDFSMQSILRFQRSTRKSYVDFNDLFQNVVDPQKLQKTIHKLYFSTSDLLKDCFIQGMRYDCENLFKPLKTAPGYCLVFNSIYTEKVFHDKPNIKQFRKFSEFDEDWTIKFKISRLLDNTSFLIYLTDPKTLLTLTDYPNYVWNHFKQTSQYGFSIQNFYADENVRKLKLSQRNCIFNDEKFPFENLNREFHTQFYNQGICIDYCQALAFLDLCKCLPPSNLKIFPKLAQKSRTCNFEDLSCYEDNFLNVRQTDCSQCLSDCNYTAYVSRPEIKTPDNPFEQELNTTYYKDGFYDLTLDLDFWPILHTRTLVIFSTTEFLLSLISLASLFLGTSFMTFFEVFYGLTLRNFFSYYANWDYLQREFDKEDKLERLKPVPCIDMSLKPKFKKLS